jgi:hypothetical protein
MADKLFPCTVEALQLLSRQLKAIGKIGRSDFQTLKIHILVSERLTKLCDFFEI